MKVIIGYPPLESSKGVPLLSQNRQYQWFHEPTYIYPVVPASAATLLKENGYEVSWLDGIAEEWSYEEWLEKLEREKPDVVVMETKTPVVKLHWKIINSIKHQVSSIKVVLVGDHVTALPEESMENCAVDYILTGGDYDFLLVNLCNHLTNGEPLEPGIWYRELAGGGLAKEKSQALRLVPKPGFGELASPGEFAAFGNTGKFQLNHSLDSLPFIDRDLTKWKLYAYKNGNYKYLPGTYIMAGRDCWWRRPAGEGGFGCTFCSWTTLYPTWRVRSVKNVLDEVGGLIEKYQIREIMDDTGTFPVGKWLKDFCRGMIERGYHKKVVFDCNMRPGALTQEDYNLMAQANFRFLLYGLESANQETLDRINKGTKADDIIKDCKMAKAANKRFKGHLEPHATCMVGHPWETKEDAERTIALTHSLFEQGLIDTLQATIIVPYPGTALFAECEKNDWLKTKNWDDYDMRQPVMKTGMGDKEILALTRGIYKSFLTPRFILRKMLSVRSLDDLKFFWRAGLKLIGHLVDFSKSGQRQRTP